jgi:RNA polymerase sigma-70 factor (ECF subfamily)
MTPDDYSHPWEETSDSLLAGLREQDGAAWTRFVEIYGPLIYSWCRRAGCNPDDAGELLQGVLVKVWAGLRTFRSADHSFRGWLAAITRNALIDFYRSRKGKPEAAGGTAAWERMQAIPADLENSTQVLDADLRHLAQRAVQVVRTTLPPESQQIFELAIVQNKSATQVATLVHCTPAAVRKAKSRLLHKLRDALGEFS